MSELVSLSIAEMQEGLRSKKFSALELTEAHLGQIDKLNEKLNAFVSVHNEESILQAKAADERLAKGSENCNAMTGIPIGIKDAIVMKDSITTNGSAILKNYRSPFDASVIHKLRKQDAVILGKTNLDQFGMGSSTEHSIFGASRNPHDTSRVSGGTSGGSAIAAASLQCPLALGADTGGSIRQPASFCGIYGLKPSYGRVSRYGLIAHASSFDQIGPMGRTAACVAEGFGAIAGHDPKDSTSVKEKLPSLNDCLKSSEEDLAGLRVGIPSEYFVSGIDPDVERAIQEGLRTLERRGATLVEISLPHTKYAIAAYYIITPAEASSNLARFDGVHFGERGSESNSLATLYQSTRSEGFGEEVKRRILVGSFVLSAGYFDAYYKKAQQVRTLIIDDFKAAFANDCDIIATPTAPSCAFPLGEKTNSPTAMYLQDIFTVPVSLAGLPALNVPCGKGEGNLPVGMQLIGPHFSESLLLSTAHQLRNEEQFSAHIPESILSEK